MYMSTTAYGSTYSVTVTVLFSGGSVQHTQNVTFDSGNYTGTTVNFTMPAMTAVQCNSIASVTAYAGDGRIFIKSVQYVTINYTPTTACTAPTSVGVNNAAPAPSASVILSWSGAGAGTNNAVVGYNIYRATSAGGTYYYLTNSATASVAVTSPSNVGSSYYYKVLTRGAAGATYYSGLSSAYAGLTTTVTACTAPTLTVDTELPEAGETVTLSGSGAAAGTNNAITGYKIYRSINGGASYSYLATVATTATSFSQSGLAIPGTAGDSYLFVVVTAGTISGFDSAQSNSVQITTVSAYCSAPTILTLSAQITAIKPTLAWSGAAPGADNAITEYEIEYAESTDEMTWGAWTALKTVASTARAGSTLVDISATLGNYRIYRIKTHGAAGADYYSDWSASSASVRTASSTVSESQTPKLIVYEYPHIVAGVEKGPYPLGMLTRYNTLIVHRKYWGISELSLSTPFSEATNELLVCWNLIGIAGKNVPYLIVSKTISRDKTGAEVIEFTAKSLVSLLGMRMVTYSSLGEAKPVALIKSLLRNQPIFLEHYSGGEWIPDINGDLAADDYGDRRFPDFHWKEPTFDIDASDALSFQPELLTGLLDTFLSLCKIEGCGARVTGDYYTSIADTLSLWLELYKGVDRSRTQDVNPHVIFSEVIGNILTQTYTHNIEGKKTAGYATSSVLDTILSYDKRLVDLLSDNAYSAGDQTYINGGSSPAGTKGGSGMNRAEIGLTVTDITAPTSGTTDEKAAVVYASCKQIGRNEVAKGVEEQTYDVTLNTAVGPQYGVDYDLGDIVTVMSPRYGISMNARITEVTETYEPGKKVQIALTLGETMVTMLGKVKQIARRRG